MNLLSKLKFILRRPKVVIITGGAKSSGCEMNEIHRTTPRPVLQSSVKEVVFQILKQYPQTARNVLISESDLKDSQDIEEFKFLVSNSSLFILVVNCPENRGEAERIQKLLKTTLASAQAWIVLGSDDGAAKEIVNMATWKVLTFGFEAGADFQVSDINITNEGTNFKINHKGSIVPIWLEGACTKDQILAALAAASIATIFDLNLIEISQALRNHPPLRV